MKIKFGSIVTDGRGKLGGHVYSKNKSGAYVRTNVIPSNPDTLAQRLVRQAFGRISQQWSALPAVNKQLWLDATKDWKNTDQFGDQKALTAKALYQGLNTQAEQAGFTGEIEKPMPKMDLELIALESAVINITDSSIVIVPNLTATADIRYQVFSTGPVGAGVISYKGKERLIRAGDTTSSSGNFTNYVTRFGLPEVGENIFIGVRSVGSNGQAGVLQMVRATIEA